MHDAFLANDGALASRGKTMFIRLIACHFLAASLSLLPRVPSAETVRIGGTGAGLGTMKVLAAEYTKTQAQIRFDIVPNLGSKGGLEAVKSGAIEISIVSRPLTAEESAQGLVAFEYGKTPFVFVTSKKGAQGLTLAQIADIYSGKVTQWPDGTPLRLVLRPTNDQDTAILSGLSPAIKEAVARALARPGMVIGTTDQGSADEIQRRRGGLGTASLALILSEQRDLAILPVEGATPGVNSLADGAYPYAKSLFLATKTVRSRAVSDFAEFVRSTRGRKILVETGHVVPGFSDNLRSATR